MKNKMIKLAALAAALVFGTPWACENAAGPSGSGGLPAGVGTVRIETGTGVGAATGGMSRTVIPDSAAFDRYEYRFAKDGGGEERKEGAGGVFELEAGSYTVTVKAFAGDGENPAAEGASGNFTVTAGESTAVTVTLVPVIDEGEGTLGFSLSYPSGVTVESFTLTRIAGDEAVSLKDGAEPGDAAFTGTKAGVGAGYWLARAMLSKGDVYAGKSEVVHIYNGVTNPLAWTFSEYVFTPIPVVNSACSGAGTLREAITRANGAEGGTIFMDLPEGGRTITLSEPLPRITTDITIEGNGATLTRSGFTESDESQLLRIAAGGTVTLRRVHFKGGRAADCGAAIDNRGILTLESCVFSGNISSGPDARGGAVYTGGAEARLTVRGCTFYNNRSAGAGGAIYAEGGIHSLAGNVFYGNTAVTGSVVSSYGGTVTSLGRNVSDKAAGSYQNGSGYDNAAGDVFNVNVLPVSPVNFKPIAGRAAAGVVLPDPLPAGYPATDFYGRAITAGGAAGAARETIEEGIYLEAGVNNSDAGSVSVAPAPDDNGSYTGGASVTLTAAAKPESGAAFRYWLVDGVKNGESGATLTVTMDAGKTVRAVFSWTREVTSGGNAGEGTLRAALESAKDEDIIDIKLGGDKTITLTAKLPEIDRGITIEGNGAVLTRSGFTPDVSSQLLRIADGKTVNIRRLHFKDGRANDTGAAIYNRGTLTLESCVFSGNETSHNGAWGGAVCTSANGSLTALGCTFYNNRSANGGGGAIYSLGTLNLAGNVFYKNSAAQSKAVYGTVNTNSGGCNVSDGAAGAWNAAGNPGGSGYTAAAGDVFDALFPVYPDFRILPGGEAAGVLASLPAGYPATDFDGQIITAGGAAGAVQAAGAAGFWLGYGGSNDNLGTVSVTNPGTEPENGVYAVNTAVTLTAAAKAESGGTFSHWLVDGTRQEPDGNTLTVTMDANKTVQAVFTRTYQVTSSADSGDGTLRKGLSEAEDGDTINISLSGDKTITLQIPLPEIASGITINGGGATLTQSGFTPGQSSQLLRIAASGSVTLRRVHFKGGRASGYGAAIHNDGALTLESCVFSDNQTTDANAWGGAVYNSGSLTALGCTFYNNRAGQQGGAIYDYVQGTVSLTGNVFYGNSAATGGVVYSVVANRITSGGCNVSDGAAGIYNSTSNPGGSGYTAAAGDVFDALFPVYPDFRILPGGEAAGVLPDPLPAGYPTTDFDGQTITAGGAAGAVQDAGAAGFRLVYGVNNESYGELSAASEPNAYGLYTAGSVTLTATAKNEATLSHWLVDGTRQEPGGNTLTVTMDANKTVQAVFTRTYQVTSGENAGAATLREALSGAVDGDTINISLTGDKTITLTAVLPSITKRLTIEGNGATLTQSGFTAGNASQLLLIVNPATVTISRLHFKGGGATTLGGAIRNTGTLTLESCVFSDNQTSADNARGGAVYSTTGTLYVRGCTFYNNRSANGGGGAIYIYSGAASLTGNLFIGNSAATGSVVYRGAGNITSLGSHGYNASDKADGATNDTTSSGYAGSTGDVFSVTGVTFDADMKPAGGSPGIDTLTSLPEGFPATYFDGSARDLPATAGAVKGGG
jgi:hypothetical protein